MPGAARVSRGPQEPIEDGTRIAIDTSGNKLSPAERSGVKKGGERMFVNTEHASLTATTKIETSAPQAC
jgi:hypothetical protein